VEMDGGDGWWRWMVEMDGGDGWWRWMKVDESIGSIPPLKVDRRLA
jgi:hypothetical protein